MLKLSHRVFNAIADAVAAYDVCLMLMLMMMMMEKQLYKL